MFSSLLFSTDMAIIVLSIVVLDHHWNHIAIPHTNKTNLFKSVNPSNCKSKYSLFQNKDVLIEISQNNEYFTAASGIS